MAWAFLVPAGPGGRCAGKTSAATLTVGLERAGAGGCRPGDGGGDVVRRSPRDMYVGWTGWACGHCWGPGGLSLSGGDIPTHRRHSAGGNSVELAGVAGRETGEAPSTAEGLLCCDCAISVHIDGNIDRQKTRHSCSIRTSEKAFPMPPKKMSGAGSGECLLSASIAAAAVSGHASGQGREFDLEIRPA